MKEGILTLPEGITQSSAHGLMEAWREWDGTGVAAIPHGSRFRQKLPDGTFEPDTPDFERVFMALEEINETLKSIRETIEDLVPGERS